jgi:hypothetical protein
MWPIRVGRIQNQFLKRISDGLFVVKLSDLSCRSFMHMQVPAGNGCALVRCGVFQTLVDHQPPGRLPLQLTTTTPEFIVMKIIRDSTSFSCHQCPKSCAGGIRNRTSHRAIIMRAALLSPFVASAVACAVKDATMPDRVECYWWGSSSPKKRPETSCLRFSVRRTSSRRCGNERSLLQRLHLWWPANCVNGNMALWHAICGGWVSSCICLGLSLCKRSMNVLCILEALTHSYEYLEHVLRLTSLFTIYSSLPRTNPAGINHTRSYPYLKKREESTSQRPWKLDIQSLIIRAAVRSSQ